METIVAAAHQKSYLNGMSSAREPMATASPPQPAGLGAVAPRGAPTGAGFGNLSVESFMRLRPSKKLHRNYSMEDIIAPFSTPIPQVEKSPSSSSAWRAWPF